MVAQALQEAGRVRARGVACFTERTFAHPPSGVDGDALPERGRARARLGIVHMHVFVRVLVPIGLRAVVVDHWGWGALARDLAEAGKSAAAQDGVRAVARVRRRVVDVVMQAAALAPE